MQPSSETGVHCRFLPMSEGENLQPSPEDGPMLHKRSEPGLFHPVPTLLGELFQVETEYLRGHRPASECSRKTRPGRRVEHDWLCDACSPFHPTGGAEDRQTCPDRGSGTGEFICPLAIFRATPYLKVAL